MGKMLVGNPPPGTNSLVFAHVWSGKVIQDHIATLEERAYHLPRNGLLIYDDNQFVNPLELRLFVNVCPSCKSNTKVDLLRRTFSACGQSGCPAISSRSRDKILALLRSIFTLVEVGLDCHYSQQNAFYFHEVGVIGGNGDLNFSDDSDIDVVN